MPRPVSTAACARGRRAQNATREAAGRVYELFVLRTLRLLRTSTLRRSRHVSSCFEALEAFYRRVEVAARAAGTWPLKLEHDPEWPLHCAHSTEEEAAVARFASSERSPVRADRA